MSEKEFRLVTKRLLEACFVNNDSAEVAHTFLLFLDFGIFYSPFWGQEGFGNDAEA